MTNNKITLLDIASLIAPLHDANHAKMAYHAITGKTATAHLSSHTITLEETLAILDYITDTYN